MRGATALVLALLHPVTAAGQAVLHTNVSLRLDGALDEPIWRQADSITDFTQTDPDEGRPATERTVVRLLATPAGLWVGVWAYDSHPEAIRRAQLRRDSDLSSDDVFTLVLDPLRDRRSGYFFEVNPNGAMTDAEVLTFQDVNRDWDGVWDARARVTPQGWTAELFIPWQTLRYPSGGGDVWGVNCARFLRRRNEEALWRAWRRSEGILFLPAEGAVAGFTELPQRRPAELRPYLSAASQFAPGHAETAKTGLDAKIAAAPTLTLDVTANTDFSQVEVDEQVVNLTRFPVFFPEKRPFFLESSGTFDFGQTDRISMFYSRRIGIDSASGSPVPLDAGARLSGRIGHERIGLLAVRTGGREDAFDVVARVKHDVFSRGYVGGIVTSQSRPGLGDRMTEGADVQFPFVVKGQNLVFGGFLATARDSARAPTTTGWRVYVDFPNDRMDHFVGFTRVTPGFDPALGFVNETDIFRHTGQLIFYPRPHGFFGLRRLHLMPLLWEVVTHLDGSRSHSFFETTILGAETQAGDALDLNLQRYEDVRDSSNNVLFHSDSVPVGHYWYNRAQVAFATSPGRTVSLMGSVGFGSYYTGSNTAADVVATVRVAPHLITQLEVSQDAVRLGPERFRARFARLRFDAAATPRLGGTVFLQYDNASDRLTLNARLHWLPAPGSDAYLVWNSGWDTALPGVSGIPWRRPAQGGLVAKFVYYVRL